MLFRSNINNIKGAWSQKTPKEKWKSLYKFVEIMNSFIGLRFLGSSRINWWSFSYLALATVYTFLSMYSVYYRLCAGNVTESLFAFCILGVMISVSCFTIHT